MTGRLGLRLGKLLLRRPELRLLVDRDIDSETNLSESEPSRDSDSDGDGVSPVVTIWKPQKVYNDGIYLVFSRHMTTYSIYLEYTWYIPVI